MTQSPKSLKILIAHGVNLDLLGTRETAIYGSLTLEQINQKIKDEASEISSHYGLKNIDLSFFQSNSEGDLLNELSKGWDGIVINPAAWTHTSLALADRLLGLKVPYVEVHLSNISDREPIRQKSFSAPKAVGVIYGFGVDSYVLGVRGLLKAMVQKP